MLKFVKKISQYFCYHKFSFNANPITDFSNALTKLFSKKDQDTQIIP